MPVAHKSGSFWRTHFALSRRESGEGTFPTMVMARGPMPLPYLTGRSRFVISPITLTLDQLLFLIVGALLCFGLIMVQSADLRVRGVTEHWVLQSFNNKNAIHAAAAMAFMALVWRLDYRWLAGRKLMRSGAFWFLVATILSLAAVLAVGSTLNGAKRWLMIPIGITRLSVQPSELAKWAAVIFVAAYAAHCQESIRKIGLAMFPIFALLIGVASLAAAALLKEHHFEKIEKLHNYVLAHGMGRVQMILACVGVVSLSSAWFMNRYQRFRTWEWGFVPLLAAVAIVAALIIKEDFGTTALIAAVAFCLIYMAGTRTLHVGVVLPPALVVAFLFVRLSPYRWERFTSFLHPEADPQGAGYHPLQSLLTIASGGFWGRGLGNGIQKMGYLPEGNTDFVFSVLCEELGFLGAGMVIALFISFVFVGWRVGSRCQNLFGKLVAFGITATVGLQAAINIAVVTVTVPTKGIALPFISSGGTGWILTAGAVGLLMSIERHNRLATAATELDNLGTQGFPVEMGETTLEERGALLEPVETPARPAMTTLRPAVVTAKPVALSALTLAGRDQLVERPAAHKNTQPPAKSQAAQPTKVTAIPVTAVAATPVQATPVVAKPVAATPESTRVIALPVMMDVPATQPLTPASEPEKATSLFTETASLSPTLDAVAEKPAEIPVKIITHWPKPAAPSAPADHDTQGNVS